MRWLADSAALVLATVDHYDLNTALIILCLAAARALDALVFLWKEKRRKREREEIRHSAARNSHR